MVLMYNILNDDNNLPYLHIVKQLNIDNKNISIERSIEILNEFVNMDKLNVEHAYLIGFNNNMDIIGVFLISVGNSKECYFYKKSIGTFLVLSGTERFLLYHNHPDGNLNLSENDIISSLHIKSLAEILEVEFIDSIVITKNGWRNINGGQVYEYDEEDLF